MAQKTEIKVVHLQVYKGAQMHYDKSGKPQNEGQLVKLETHTRQYDNFLKFMHRNGYASVEVVKVLDKGNDLKELSESDKVYKDIVAEISSHFKVEKEEVSKDPRDIAIAELKAEIEAMKAGKKEEVKEKKAETQENLDELKEEYKELYGKLPHHTWGEDKVRSLIDEKKLSE